LRRARAGANSARSRSSRASSTPPCDAMSSSITSTELPSVIDLQCSQVPQGVGVGPVLAVDRGGQDPGGRGLAGAARSGEQVGVGEAILLDRVGQGARHVLLPDHLGERAGSVTAVERDVGHLDLPGCAATDGDPHRSAGQPARTAAPALAGRREAGRPRRLQATGARDRHPPENGLGLLPLGPDPVHRRTSPADARHLGPSRSSADLGGDRTNGGRTLRTGRWPTCLVTSTGTSQHMPDARRARRPSPGS
jgi:hypothetical protein